MLESIPLYHVVKDGIGFLWHRRQSQKLSNTEIIEKRQHWKPLFEERILKKPRKIEKIEKTLSFATWIALTTTHSQMRKSEGYLLGSKWDCLRPSIVE